MADLDDVFRVLPLVKLSKAQEERFHEEAQDVKDNGTNLSWVNIRLEPFQPALEGESIQDLLRLALHRAEDEASGGKYLDNLLNHVGTFLIIDERSARSLSDDAEESFNVLAIDVDKETLQDAAECYMEVASDPELQKAATYLSKNPPKDSAAARLRLPAFVRSGAKDRIEGSFGSDWAKNVSFHWNVDETELHRMLSRKEGEDGEVLHEISLIRLTWVRAELEAAAATMSAASVKDPIDMYAGLAAEARKDPDGVARPYRYEHSTG